VQRGCKGGAKGIEESANKKAFCTCFAPTIALSLKPIVVYVCG